MTEQVHTNSQPAENLDDYPLPRNPDVGVLGVVPDTWSCLWQPRHHIMTRLAQHFRVNWLEPQIPWRHAFKFNSSATADTLDTALGFHRSHLMPWYPRFDRPQWLGHLTHDLRIRSACNRLRSQGCKQLVLYAWRPAFARALQSYPFSFTCYHIDDEYTFSDEEQPVSKVEEDLIRSVDHVFIHSPALVEKKGDLNPHMTYIPNGVDFKAHTSIVPEPTDMKDIPHPRVGYSGYLKNQLDWKLIDELSARHQEWHFVLVGARASHTTVADIIKSLAGRPNVYFLGAKHHNVLATYPQYFDVCVMPYRLNDYTKFIFPMKLNEYLASGRPCVGVPIPSLENFKEVVSLAKTTEEWERAITLALSENCNNLVQRKRRQDIARGHDWDALSSRIAATILAGLERA